MNKYQESLDRQKENIKILREKEFIEYADDFKLLQELVDKETSMEVNMEYYKLEDEYQYPIYSCPECGKHLNDGDSYCRHCGQRLEWKDDE